MTYFMRQFAVPCNAALTLTFRSACGKGNCWRASSMAESVYDIGDKGYPSPWNSVPLPSFTYFQSLAHQFSFRGKLSYKLTLYSLNFGKDTVLVFHVTTKYENSRCRCQGERMERRRTSLQLGRCGYTELSQSGRLRFSHAGHQYFNMPLTETRFHVCLVLRGLTSWWNKEIIFDYAHMVEWLTIQEKTLRT